MFSERSGISAAGVGTLLASVLITQIVSEVPTGMIADRFSKKYSIALGKLLKAAGLAVWLVAPTFSGYLMGFVVWGIGEAFNSGALQAYLYEAVGGDKKVSYLKSASRIKAATMLSYVIAYGLTFIIGTQYQLLIVLSVIAVSFSFLLSLTLPATPSISKTNELLLGKALRVVKNSPIVKRRFYEGVLIAGTLTTMLEIIVINYRDYGVEPRVVPLIISGVTIASAFLYWSLDYYESFFRKYIISIAMILMAFFLVLYTQSLWLQVLGLFFVTRFYRITAVVQEADLQDVIEGSSRATVLSLYSLLDKLLSAGMLFAIGIFATNENIEVPTNVTIVVTILLFIILKFFERRSIART